MDTLEGAPAGPAAWLRAKADSTARKMKLIRFPMATLLSARSVGLETGGDDEAYFWQGSRIDHFRLGFDCQPRVGVAFGRLALSGGHVRRRVSEGRGKPSSSAVQRSPAPVRCPAVRVPELTISPGLKGSAGNRRAMAAPSSARHRA